MSKTLWASLAVALSICWLSTDAAGLQAAEPKQLPDFATIQKIVAETFSAESGHRPGDLIARGEVEPLFAKFEKAGWKVADRKEICQSLLSDQHVLVKKLHTQAGKKFMRQVADDPEVYDRLDRFVRLPRGERMLQDLIDGPDGYKLFDYMTKTSGGHELGKMLSNAPRGRDFNDETGRIYTVKMLDQRLKTSYARAEAQARGN